MLEALALLKQAPIASPAASFTPEPLPQTKSKTGLKLLDLIDEFFLLKSHSKPATVIAYKNVAKAASYFLGNTFIQDTQLSDIIRLQEFLSKKNGPRTVDNKMAVLRTLFSFAKNQGYFFCRKFSKRQKNFIRKGQS